MRYGRYVSRIVQGLTACALAMGVALAAAANAAPASGYRVDQGRLYDPSGQELQLRGVNMFGFNTDVLMPTYLWTMGWREQIAQVKSLGFNAVRVPFVPATLYSGLRANVDLKTYIEPSKNRELLGKRPLEILDLWMAEAARQNLYVLLDFHSVTYRGQYQTWYVTDPEHYGIGKWAETYNGKPYTQEDWIRDLVFVAKRYAHLPNFIGIDIYNEPNGHVRWGPGDKNAYKPENDWKLAAEAASRAVLKANPRLLIFVQGIEANWDGREQAGLPINWGENLQPQAYLPLEIPRHKLVLSPHTYGPDALHEFPKESFKHPRFPANLERDWETLFGQFHPKYAVVPGEFGGFYGTGPSGVKDKLWQDALIEYFIKKGIHSGFYWTYTPNSYNTGGILDDQLKVREDKMALLRRWWNAVRPQPANDAG